MHRHLFAFAATAAMAAATDKGDAVTADDAKSDAATVDAADTAEVEPEAERPFTDEEAKACMGDLVVLDVKARAVGHSLAEILAVLAQNTYGIDVR